jgi:hypothetical protein
MADALLSLARATGDTGFCAPVASAAGWLVRSAIAPSCWARFYAPGTNAPVYVDARGRPVPTHREAKSPYRWIGDYGIPGLLASLGLDTQGRPLDAAAAAAVPRLIPGDSGFCPEDAEYRHVYETNARMRIAFAATALAALTPLPPSPCPVTVAP